MLMFIKVSPPQLWQWGQAGGRVTGGGCTPMDMNRAIKPVEKLTAGFGHVEIPA